MSWRTRKHLVRMDFLLLRPGLCGSCPTSYWLCAAEWDSTKLQRLGCLCTWHVCVSFRAPQHVGISVSSPSLEVSTASTFIVGKCWCDFTWIELQNHWTFFWRGKCVPSIEYGLSVKSNHFCSVQSLTENLSDNSRITRLRVWYEICSQTCFHSLTKVAGSWSITL